MTLERLRLGGSVIVGESTTYMQKMIYYDYEAKEFLNKIVAV